MSDTVKDTVAAREVLKIVVVGHVDHGKSTLIGRLLYDTNSLPEGAIDKVKRISKETGKPFEYAYLLDAFEEEQKQGITIDTTSLQFHTSKRDYVIIDAPGHVEFLKNMISGAANAEAALLMVDANEGIQEQSKRHGYILSLLGIRKVYVVINKMDLVDYSQERYEEIKNGMKDFLGHLHIYPLKYIPVSAVNGENIATKSDKMPWYADKPVLDAIDEFEKDKELVDKPLRFPIQDVYKFDDRRIIAGRVESGSIHVGDEILIQPGNKTTHVKSVEHWAEKDRTDFASAGMSTGITVTDEFFNFRGEVISQHKSRPIVGDSLDVNIFWMGKKPLKVGSSYKLKLATQETMCEVTQIKHVVDTDTLGEVDDVQSVATNGVAEVTLKTKTPIVFDLFKNNHATGRFVLVDGYDVCGGGIVSGEAEGALVHSVFSEGGRRLEVTLFDDFYYSPDVAQIFKTVGHINLFSEEDILPLSGTTYAYPNDFDVADIANSLVAEVRGGKLEALVSFDEYTYDNVSMLAADGCALKVSSEAEWNKYVDESHQKNIDEVKFFNKWFDFEKYRTIRFGKN
ncbi:MAG TPA: sulfate adenylyltransferase [Ruminococcaceae bacterium]|nr:sulfate adenylyltransferase [Oscillospiraceae bacterium]